MVIICRHGQTEWNKANKLQGSQDSPLTQIGIVQSIKVGEALRNIIRQNATQIYSSPLARALDTSKIIANTLRLPHQYIQQNDLLREMSFGAHEGMTKKERSMGQFAIDIEKRAENPYRNELPGGENYNQVQERAQKFIDTTEFLPWDIIVAHEAFNRMLLGTLGGLSQDESLNVSQPNDVVYRYQGGALYHKILGNTEEWILGVLTNK